MRNPMRRIIPLLLCLTLASVSYADDAAKQHRPILVLDAGGHTASVRRVLFTPDGRVAVEAGLCAGERSEVPDRIVLTLPCVGPSTTSARLLKKERHRA
jgi:hypothetical protein